jgi:hypothetical protein
MSQISITTIRIMDLKGALVSKKIFVIGFKNFLLSGLKLVCQVRAEYNCWDANLTNIPVSHDMH